MKLQSSILLLSIGTAGAFFVPSTSTSCARSRQQQPTALSFGVDPSAFHDIPNHMQSLQDVFSTFSLADAMDAVPDAAAGAVEEAAKNDNGGFGFLTGPIKGLLQVIHSGIVATGTKENAWGVAIILLTILIKIGTFPLTKAQLESTNKMQALQPIIKDIQAKYQSNPEVMNQKIAEVYQTNQVNPLAGCIPSLVQIPVFIGLYRAVLDLAKEDKLNEGFLWLPSLEGPVYDADPTKGSQWLFNWVDGAPALGWDDTLAFLVLPVLLVISQFVSMELMTPKDQQQQGNIVLKLLPLMIGWFSLNVPSALCLYWMVNNIVTTATSLIIRSNMPPPATISTSGSATASPPPTDIFAPPPMREKPAGFSSSSTPSVGADGVKPITSVDAEIVDDEDDDDDGSDDASESAPSESSKKRGGKKGKRKN